MPAGVSIYIEPGTEIVFLPPAEGEDTYRRHPNFPGSELIVRGRLVAEGRADAPITFRSLRAADPAGSWGGVNLEESADSRFRFCRFTQADSALHSRQSALRVNQSVFEANHVGARFHSSRIILENNDFVDNGTAVRFHFGSPLIRRNLFRGNGKAFFITSHPRDYKIEQNVILESLDYQVVLGEAVPGDVPMLRNFWGSTDPEWIAGQFFDGRRSDYIGRVLFRPFLPEPPARAGASWNR